MAFSPARGCAVAAVALMIGCPAHAALLNLQLQPTPDIYSGFITLDYNAGTDWLSAQGYAFSLNDGSGSYTIAGGTFDLTATIDDFGGLSSGALSIGGDVNNFGPTLLTGDMIDFGFMDPPGGDLFEFLFTVTGGDLATMYGGMGSQFGVVLGAMGAGFDGTFTNNFANNGQGVADAAPIVPGPSALIALAAGLGLTASTSRRRRVAV